MGLGIWHPDGSSLGKIRKGLVEDPGSWKRVRDGKRFSDRFELAGDALKRAPKGFDPDDPLIEDLKRKDFIAVAQLNQKQITAADFLDRFTQLCRAGSGFVKYLCGAVGVPF